MRTGTFLLLFAFLAGGAIGYVVGSQGSPGDVVPLPVPGPSKPKPEARDDGGLILDPGGSHDGVDIASLVRSTPGSAAPKGTGRIDGTVVDEAGERLAGVVVRATARGSSTRYYRPSPPDGSAPENLTLEEEILWFVGVERDRRARRRETVTGPDGTFAFTGLTNVEHHVRAYRRGMRFQKAGGGSWTAIGSTIKLVGHLQGLVTNEVIGPDGLPMDQAFVAYHQGNPGMSSRQWSRDRPSTALALGEWKVKAEGGPDRIYASKHTTVRLTREEPEAKVTLRLEPRPGVRGRVVFLSDEPEATVEVRADPDPMPEDREVWSSRRRRSATAAAANGGGFYIKDLEPGRYVVRLVGFPDEVGSRTVTVGDGPADVELVIPPPSPDTSVLIRATGPDGKAVPDLKLNEYLSYEGGSTYGGGRSVRLADGVTYRFYFSRSVTDLRKEGPGKVERSISARSSLYGEESVPVPLDAKQVEVAFVEPGKLTVAIDNWGDTGREPNIRIVLLHGTVVGRHTDGARIGKDGTRTWGPIRPGEYTVVLSHPIGRHYRMAIASAVVNVSTGENRANLSIPKFYTLTAVVEGGEEASFELEAADGSWDTFPEETKNGEISWEVPAGEYVINPWGSGDLGPRRRVRVPAETRVVFRKFQPDCMQVRITGTGALQDAGFRDGDFIIGVNGKEFTDRRQMKALMTLAERGDAMTLMVLRGGKTLAIKVVKSLFKGGRKEMGGTFERAARPR